MSWSNLILALSFKRDWLCYSGTKKRRCGQCRACKSVDCGQCRYCLDKKKFGGHNRLKQCCIHRRCDTYNTSLSENKQPPHTQSAVHDTMKEFCGMFGWCLFTCCMQVFNTSLPPLGHSVSLLASQTPAKSKEVLKVSDTLQWHNCTRTHAGLRPAELSECQSKTV